jgi:hypothetical protein
VLGLLLERGDMSAALALLDGVRRSDELQRVLELLLHAAAEARWALMMASDEGVHRLPVVFQRHGSDGRYLCRASRR